MMVIWLGLMPMCFRMSGSTPWPIEPKPIMTMRPLKSMCLPRASFFVAIFSSCLVREWSSKKKRGLFQGPVDSLQKEARLDADRLERRKTVERDGRVRRRVGPGRQDLDLVAGLQRQ